MPYIQKTIIALLLTTASVGLTGCTLDHTILLNVDENGDGQKEKLTVDISTIDDTTTEVTVSRDNEPDVKPAVEAPVETPSAVEIPPSTEQPLTDNADEENETDYSNAVMRDNERLSEVRRIQTFLELFYSKNSTYPTYSSPIILGTDNFACLGKNGFEPTGCAEPFLAEVPSDPLSPESNYTYIATDGKNYKVDFYLETNETMFKSGKVQASPSGMKNI